MKNTERKKKRQKELRVKILVGVVALVILAGGGIYALSHMTSKTIYDGVYVGELSVGNMTPEEAQVKIDAYVDELMASPIVLTMGEKTLEVTPEEIGLSKKGEEKLAEEAHKVGNTGDLFARHKERKALKDKKVILGVSLTLDEEVLKSYLDSKLEELNTEPVDNGLKLENGVFRFVPGADGVVLNEKETIKNLAKYFSNIKTSTFDTQEMVCEVEEARGSEEELMQVKDVLGSFHTDYSTSAEGRCTNVANATSLIDGTVLFPGETFSVHDTISPISLENGYAMAGAYENGTVVESVGGGVCQVSSTLYNAVIRAELEVVERFPHSMVVSYVEPSDDAAIAGDYKDFKFTNNSEHPIYIQGYTASKQIYFNVYGIETRDSNRTVSFESEIESTEEPEVTFTTTDNAIGYVSRVQGSHTGYKATLYKVVKVNGKVESREAFNHSTYKASPAIYEVGIKSSNPDAVAAMKEAIATGDLAKVKAAAAYWSADAVKEREEKENNNSNSGNGSGNGTSGSGNTTENGHENPSTNDQEPAREALVETTGKTKNKR